MKKVLGLVLGAILLTSGVSYGADLHMSWTPYVSNGATELRILDKDTNVVWTGPLTATETVITVPDECGSWYMTAANDTLESKNSNVIQWCPDIHGPGGLVLEFELITDNGNVGTTYTGAWKKSGGLNPYGDDSVYSSNAGDSYSFVTLVDGQHEVYLWWTEYKSRSTEVSVEVYDGDLLVDTVIVDQKANGGKWNLLGTYEFKGVAKVVVISKGNGSTSADAVKVN